MKRKLLAALLVAVTVSMAACGQKAEKCRAGHRSRGKYGSGREYGGGREYRYRWKLSEGLYSF